MPASRFSVPPATALKVWRVNMDVPISLAILLSLVMSMYQTAMHTDQVYFDACVSLLFFLLIGRFLDQRTRTQARSAAQNLLGLKSQWASVIADGGIIERLPAYLVTPGMRVSVAAGERMPVDGKLAAGVSDVDESLITGETLPRTVRAGDTVYAGTVNLGAAVEIVASATENGSVLAEIVRLMEAAEQSRSRYVRLADRAARLYAPGVHTLAAVTFIGWMLAGQGWEAALTAAIAVLIITCPCALALAVPAVQVAAASRLFARGVLVKAPDGLERLAEVDTIVFDKTGTLTHGIPALKNAGQIGADDLKSAASLAANSRHPYAVAVVTAARNAFGEIAVASDVTETPGAGLERLGEQGAERLGSASWCGVEDAHAGQASLWYARPGHAPVGFVFEDELRQDAAK